MLTALISKYALAASLTLAAAGWAATGIQTLRLSSLKLKNAEALAYEQTKARAKEQQWNEDNLTAEEVQREELDKVSSARNADLQRVRDYYKRLSNSSGETSAPTCPATVPESTVAAVVAVESDADSLRADYGRCLAWINSVKR